MRGIWPGLTERIHRRVAELGYDNLAQFSDAKGWRVTYLYKYAPVNGGRATIPDYPNLIRLAKDLEVHPAWLLFGDEIKPLIKAAKKVVAMALLTLNLLWGGGDAHASARPESLFSEARRRRIRRLRHMLLGLTPREFPRLVHRAALG